MEQKQFDELVAKLGKEAAEQVKKESQAIEEKLIGLVEEKRKGLITGDEFEKFKGECLSEVNQKLQKLEDIAKEQGNKIAESLTLKNGHQVKSIETLLQEKKDELAKIKAQGFGSIEISLKAAGVVSITNSIAAMDNPPDSPYAPGIGGNILELFDTKKNPNFIMNYVDLGRTNQSRLAWLNEIAGEGAPDTVAEGAAKPLVDYDFKVELSIAKKIAGMVKITEEFEDDLPGLATQVRRMLMEDVIRKFDDAIYTNVIAAAPGFTTTYFDGKVQDANYWDAIRAGVAQVASNNYTANFIALNPLTAALMDMTKNNNGSYLKPPFTDELNAMMREANKVATGKVLVGDISQYKVDIYKDFVLKLGWNNDDFQRNQYSVVGEVRYHDYISDNRKKALAYYDLDTVVAEIDKTATT